MPSCGVHAAKRRRAGAIVALSCTQSWQYRNLAYRRLLDKRGPQQSMSGKGNCLDNALVESIFGHLKEESEQSQHSDLVAESIQEPDTCMPWYNHVQIKERLNGLSAVQYRKQLQAATSEPTSLSTT